MKSILKKYKNCKNIREILDKIDIKNFYKLSFILLLIWILTPILVMCLNPLVGKKISYFIIFNILIVLGNLGLFIGLIYYLKNYYKKNNKFLSNNIPLLIALLLFIWCLITCFFSINKTISFTGSLYRREGLNTYLAYLGIFLLGILLRDEKYQKKLFNFFIIVEVVLSIISIINNNITYMLLQNQEAYDGIFEQFNHYGYYLMFGILLSLFMLLNTKTNKKYVYLITYALFFYTLLINDTFGCILSILITLLLTFVAILLFHKKQKKQLIIIFITTLLISFSTVISNDNILIKNFKSLNKDLEIVEKAIRKKNTNEINSIGTTRGLLWKYGIKYITKKPITGYGIETLDILYIGNQIHQDRPHNILIQMGVFTGIPGILLYSIFILSILHRSIKKINKFNILNLGIFMICLCYLMSSMFGNSMYYTSPYFCIFLGMLFSSTLNIKRQV